MTAHSASEPDTQQRQFMDAYLTKLLTFLGLYRPLSQWLDTREDPWAGTPVDGEVVDEMSNEGRSLADERMVERELVLQNLGGNPRSVISLPAEQVVFSNQYGQFRGASIVQSRKRNMRWKWAISSIS
ncbi:hypothetical protein [Salicola sp. Rm-C-2C1-2]|uniref:hypothetical protein n=1 Tax=Salicola sp. Rm-C-2C1-2 TaxID=3141321 RepID=UPI0032E37903